MVRRILVLIALLVATPVAAQPGADARARAHFVQGKELVGQERFTDALREFSEGYELSGRPAFLFNMAECSRALRDLEQARRSYEAYLAADPHGPYSEQARARLAELPPPVVIPPPAAAAAAVAAPTPAPAPAPTAVTAVFAPARSHFKRNAILVGVGVALVAGSIAIYAGTRGPACGPGCVDLR